jgi:hypothetical protein
LPEFAKITPNLRDTISCWQTTVSQIFYVVRESSFTPYLAFGLAAIFLTSKIPYFLLPKAPPNLSMKDGSLFCSYEI